MLNQKFSLLVKKRLTNEKGFVSILVTSLALIAVLVVAFLIDRTTQNFTMQEVRGIMDSSAQNTLISVLSDDLLKEELFGFSDEFISDSDFDQEYPIPLAVETELRTHYSDQLNRYVATSDILLDYQIEDVRFKFAKGKWGLGSTASKSRPYLVLDSVVQLTLRHIQSFDYSDSFFNRTYQDVDGNTFEIQAAGTPNGDEILIVVRSVSRAVFR